jgi:hypothetical protein
LKLPAFLHPVELRPATSDSFFFRQVVQWLSNFGIHALVYSSLAYLLVYAQAIMLNRIVNTHRLLQKQTHLPAMTYLLITSVLPQWYFLSSPLVVNTFMVWILSQLCKMHNAVNPRSLLFNIGMVTGVATFFYLPAIAFILLIIVGLAVTRPFKLQEWIVVLLGIITPYYFLASWYFLTGSWRGYSIRDIRVAVPTINENIYVIIAAAIMLTAILIGSYFIQSNFRRQIVQTRKSWVLIFVYLFVSLIVPFLNTDHSLDYWLLTVIPVSAIISAAFLYPEKRWFPFTVHWGLVILSIIAGYFVKLF